MSASLVGSEMCIRDRNSWKVSMAACVWRDTRHTAGEHDSTEDKWGATKGSVSYTHLTLPTICSV
eukprot:6316246-Alexandrium_andersonii.AAC.1